MLLDEIKKGKNKPFELKNSLLLYENSNYFIDLRKCRKNAE